MWRDEGNLDSQVDGAVVAAPQERQGVVGDNIHAGMVAARLDPRREVEIQHAVRPAWVSVFCKLPRDLGLVLVRHGRQLGLHVVLVRWREADLVLRQAVHGPTGTPLAGELVQGEEGRIVVWRGGIQAREDGVGRRGGC